VDSEKLHIYEILARQHEPMLLAYVLSLVSDLQLAEDIAQDTFLIAYRKISTLHKPDSFGAWLRGIARWEVLAALRKRGTEIPFEPAVLEGMEDVFASLEQQQTTEKWQERFQVVEDCFRELPEKLHRVCQLHYFEDQKAQDIAAALHIGLSAVLKRLERARDAIRKCVQKRLKMENA
jgi:RNA polymerase sigma-70 factor (ECF subfamily)